MNKGILFDVDGTLWDSAAQMAESWNEVLARYPHSGVRIMAQDMYNNMGETTMGIGEISSPGLAQEECRKVMEECMTYKNHYLLTRPGVLYPEAGEITARPSCQYGLYIASNCQSGYIEMLLKGYSLREYVRDIECYGNTGLPKGDNIRMVVRGGHLERCFYMGDTHVDEKAAGVVGIPFIHASYGFGRAGRSVDTIESLSGLSAPVKELLDQEQDMNQEERKEARQTLELFLNESLERVLTSNPVDSGIVPRSEIHPLLMRGGLIFRAEEQAGKQVFHCNLDKGGATGYVTGLLEGSFRQAEITSGPGKALILVSKKDKVTVKVRRYPESVRIQPAGEPGPPGSLSHNRKKHYILGEEVPVSFLVDSDIMTKEGRVVNSRYDKYRQINRFPEFIEDILPNLDQGREFAITDFGCGKSYLTFAMCYYSKELKRYPVRIIGLDLKKDVIEHCSHLERQYGYGGPSFCHGDIASSESIEEADMMVTPHACDLAAGHALEEAINWGARVILLVPCCQRELNGQMEDSLLRPAPQYSLIKKRMAVPYTDVVRTQVLEYRGYRIQTLELIDMEHTSRNILIRAVHQGRKRNNGLRIRELAEFLHVGPTVAELLVPELWEPREKTTDV